MSKETVQRPDEVAPAAEDGVTPEKTVSPAAHDAAGGGSQGDQGTKKPARPRTRSARSKSASGAGSAETMAPASVPAQAGPGDAAAAADVAAASAAAVGAGPSSADSPAEAGADGKPTAPQRRASRARTPASQPRKSSPTKPDAVSPAPGEPGFVESLAAESGPKEPAPPSPAEGPAKAAPAKAPPAKAAPAKAVPAKAAPARAGSGKSGPGKAPAARAASGKSGPGKAAAAKSAPEPAAAAGKPSSQPRRKAPAARAAKAGGSSRSGATRPPAAASPGDKIAGYRIEQQIGQGGMAVVYRALDEHLDRHVALKLLAPGLAADTGFRQRFIRESRSAAAVDHPNIIPIYEAGDAAGALFIAMRYVQGGDVRSLLEQGGPLSPSRTWAIITQVAAALDAAHAHGLIHRDVKPANMLLDAAAGEGASGARAQHVYLSDFGISKQPLGASSITMTGQFVGTLDYIAPEQIDGSSVDGRTDLYSLGCAAFELITGTPPYSNVQGLALIRAHMSDPSPAVTARRNDLPSAVNAVVGAAMAKAPAERYATCTQFALNLGRALGLAPGAPELPGAQPPPGGARPWPATELAAPAPAPVPVPAPAPAAPPSVQYYPQQPAAPQPVPIAGQQTMAPSGQMPAMMGGIQQGMPAGGQMGPAGPWMPGTGGWPQQPPPARRRPIGTIVAIASIVAVAAAAVVAVILVGHKNSSNTPAAGHSSSVSSTVPSSSTSPSGSTSSTPQGPSGQPTTGVTSQPRTSGLASTQANNVSALLSQGSGSANSLNNAVNDVAACGNVANDVSVIEQVENQRQTEYREAQSTAMGSLPNGAQMKSALVNALYYSYQADRDYLQWANQVETTGCGSGSQSAALAADQQAVTYKNQFMSLWNPVAPSYNLPTVSQGQI